jgi:hypothetical protein
MKLVKVVAVILVGPVIGLVLGLFLGSFFLPSDPTGHGAPGDGFLLILTGGAGFIVFGIASVLFAARIWRRSSGPEVS